MDDKVSEPRFTSTATPKTIEKTSSNAKVIKRPNESNKLKSKHAKRRHDAKSADHTESDSDDQDSTSGDSENDQVLHLRSKTLQCIRMNINQSSAANIMSQNELRLG